MGENNDEIEIDLTDLESGNQELVNAQAHQINRELTKLKRISSHTRLAPITAEKTGQFITVPVSSLVTPEIAKAMSEAEQARDRSSIPPAPKKKKRWFNWG